MFGYFVDFNETPKSLSRFKSRNDMIVYLCKHYHVYDKWEESLIQLRKALSIGGNGIIDHDTIRSKLRQMGISNSRDVYFNLSDNWYLQKPAVPKIPKKITIKSVEVLRSYLISLYHYYKIRSDILYNINNKLYLNLNEVIIDANIDNENNVIPVIDYPNIRTENIRSTVNETDYTE
jgi:hypothetical protein